MEENPLLEEISPDEGNADAIHEEVENDVVSVERENVKAIERTEELNVEEGGNSVKEFDWDNYLEDSGRVGVTYGGGDGEETSWDNILTESQSLTQYLMWQMKLSSFTEDEIRVCTQIVGNLDQNGYLCATVPEIAQLENTSDEFVEAVLKRVQEFDPPGIAARNLQECLLIQARMLGVQNKIIEVIIKEFLKELELKNYVHIAHKLKVPLREVEIAVLLIKS